jgi:hypothetical protein
MLPNKIIEAMHILDRNGLIENVHCFRFEARSALDPLEVFFVTGAGLESSFLQ